MLGYTYPRFQTVPKLGLKMTAMLAEEDHRFISDYELRKPRVLCLHGFRTSARILQTGINQWPETVVKNLDLDFLDGPFPANGKSDVEGIFDPPYYEWYQASKGFTEYRNFEKCLVYIEDYMIKNGPFDGLLGFSQGAFLSAALPGLQAQGTALTKVPKIKFVVLISGAKYPGLRYGQPKAAVGAYSSLIRCPSLHFIGERDYLKKGGEALTKLYVEPVVIRHPGGHIVPKIETKADEETVLSFFQRIRQMLSDEESYFPRSML